MRKLIILLLLGFSYCYGQQQQFVDSVQAIATVVVQRDGILSMKTKDNIVDVYTSSNGFIYEMQIWGPHTCVFKNADKTFIVLRNQRRITVYQWK